MAGYGHRRIKKPKSVRRPADLMAVAIRPSSCCSGACAGGSDLDLRLGVAADQHSREICGSDVNIFKSGRPGHHGTSPRYSTGRKRWRFVYPKKGGA